ncbi:uncharacterized protein [Rutidosis leptorrhynchoides]|uniref:uncharacterized protein n=1 Tax=Rutidosis leptorrhynchoides TaxID=125765 RepID=UPI003A9A49AA
MAARSFLYGGDTGGAAAVGGVGGLVFNSIDKRVPALDSIFASGSSHSFLGSRSMVSFEDKKSGSFFQPMDHDDNGDDEYDEYFHHPEKKRRLKADQIQFLEKSFETENKLEPERKIQLAKDLGLQPRQIAIWFQNRRARWKTKQLEKDYDILQESYNQLKANYNNLLEEKEKLKSEVLDLSGKLLQQETEKGTSDSSSTKSPCEPLQQEQVTDCVNDDVAVVSVESYSSSPGYLSDVQSLFERGESTYLFEPDQSDGPLDEEASLETMFVNTISSFLLPKIESGDYSNSYYLGFNVHDQDQPFGFWSY